MYTQNTPIHVKLWHKDFWLLSTAGMLINIIMYLQFALLPVWMFGTTGFSPSQVAIALGVSGLGMFSLGCFCSYWVQRYRRNQVCIKAVLVILLCFCILYYLNESTLFDKYLFAIIIAIRFIQGAAFGIAQTVLSGVLIIDTCESFKRTEANYSSTWLARLALSLGPVVAIVTQSFFSFDKIILFAAFLCLLSVICLLSVKFPFKAPEDVLCKVSLDRFFLPQSKWLFVNLFMITVVVGLLFSVEHSLSFYGFLMIGFFLALLSQRFVFVNADLKSEITTGLILMLVALLMNFSDYTDIIYLYPVLIGCGIGIIGSCFLLSFIKLKGHCQRSTSYSSFLFSWESGLYSGIFIGYFFFYYNKQQLILLSILLVCWAMVLYLLFTHNWYIKNKNR